jgi:hypothetical protein
MTARSGLLWLGFGIAASVTGLWLVDRLFLWMERRGWMYWRRRKGTPGRASVASAALEFQTLLEPAKRYVLALKKEEKTLADDDGAPPDPGPSPRGRSR